MLCGDFNITAGSEGYELVVKSNEYDDQFLAANSHGVFEKIFKGNDPHWQHYLADDHRIDYIFMNKSSELKVIQEGCCLPRRTMEEFRIIAAI